MLSQLLSVITYLGWSHINIVIDDTVDGDLESVLTQNLSDRGVQHVLVSGSEALSGDWLHQVVRTGVDSWRPLHFVLMCSVSCIVSTLTQATTLEEKLRTLSAFPLTSRWLVVMAGSDRILNPLDIIDITMENGSDRILNPLNITDITMENGSDRILNSLNITDITMENVVVIDFSAKSCNRTKNCCHETDESKPRVYVLSNTPERRSWSPVFPCDNRVSIKTTPAALSTSQANSSYWDSVLFPHARHGYNGRRLRVAVKEWMAFLNSRQENDTKVWYGLLMDILQEAATVLNFTYDLVDASEEPWGSGTAKDPEFGTFYGHVIRKEVDLGLTPTDTLSQRTPLMDFTDVIMFSSAAMVYRPLPSGSFNGLLSVVSPSLLAAIGGTLAVVTLVVVCFEVACSWSQTDDDKILTLAGMCRKGHARTPSCGSTLLNVLHSVLAALLSEPIEVEVTSQPSRMLMWSWRMLSLVLAAAYSGTLTAFLSSSQQPLLFSRPQDLLTKTHTYTWGTIRDNSVSIFLEGSKDPLYREIWSRIQQFTATDPGVLTTNTTALVSKVRHEDFVLIMDYTFALDLFRMYNDVIIVNTDMRSVMFGLVVPKGSALAAPLSDVIQGLHSSGLLSKWTHRWFPHTLSSTTPPGQMVISLLHVQDVLLVLPVGAGLSLGIMTLEVIYLRWKKKWICQTVVT